MNFTIQNIEGLPAFQIRPHNTECWELWEYRPVKEKESGKATGRMGFKWVSMNKYPTTLSGAFLTLYEQVLKRSDLDITGYEETMQTVKRVAKEVRDAERG